MTRYTQEQRDSWSDDVERCSDCGMEINGKEPNDCRCEKEVEDLF